MAKDDELREDFKEVKDKVDELTIIVGAGFAETKTLLENQEKDLEKLNRIIVEGNGQKPLVTRVALNEKEVKTLYKLFGAKKEEENINKKGKWGLIVAVTSGVFGLIIAVISLISQLVG